MIFHVFANRSNIGDWLSAKGIQSLLAPYTVTECLCDKPFVKETIEILHSATRNDLIIVGGGGLFMDYFIPFWKKFRIIAERIPFFIWGVGCCDIKHENSIPPLSIIGKIIERSKLCIVRDEITKNFLSGFKIPSPVACPAVNIIEPVDQPGTDVLHVVNYTTAGKEAYLRMREAAQSFSLGTGRIYRETNNRINPGSILELEHLQSVYKKSGIILTSALHGCIIGAAMGLKVLAVSGDRKIESFMEKVGLQDWVLDISETHLIHDMLTQLDNQPSCYADMEQIRDRNEKIAEIIKKIVSDVQPL